MRNKQFTIQIGKNLFNFCLLVYLFISSGGGGGGIKNK